MSFINKVVIVTGAASGIGEAISILFAKHSARLSLIDINIENLYKVAEVCENLSKAKVFKVVADVSKDDELKRAVKSVIKEYLRIDVVINCAGITSCKGIESDVMNVFDKVININLRSTVAMVHYVARELIKVKGCIINIASVMADLACKGSIPYNVSKAGIVQFTKNVALELAGKGVRVNCISPGGVKTNILLSAGLSKEESDSTWEGMAKAVPLKHIIKAEEIAEMAVYLASDKAKSITGANFVIDSGLKLTGMSGFSKE